MAETKFGFQIGSALASNHLTDSKYIQGTYHVVDDITARDALKIKSGTDDGVIIKGSLVYVVDEEKTYRYDGTSYEEEASGGSGGSTVGWKYKGEVATAANLPTGPAKGDIYTVTSKVVDGETVADGHNYFAHMQSLEIPLVDELSTAQLMCQCFELFDRKEIEDAFQNYPYFGAYSHPGPTQITLIFSNNPIILGITSTNGEVERVLAKADEEFKIFGARKVSNTEKILVNVTLTKGTTTVTIDGEEYTYYTVSAPEVTWNTFYYYNNSSWIWANYLPKTFDFRTSTKTDMTNYSQKEVEIIPSGLVWKLVSGVDDGSEEDPHLEAIKTAISTNDEDGNISYIVGETWVMDNDGWISNVQNGDLTFKTQVGPTSASPSVYSSLNLCSDGNGFEIEAKNDTSGKTFKFGTNITDLQAATADTTYTVKTDGIYLNGEKITGGSSSVKIYDNDDDTTTEGKLWNCTDGKLVIDNLTANYSELEIYYSQKDTSEIQYYKINTELITLPKTNKGMFYIFDPTIDLYRLEKVEVTYNLKEDAAEGDKKAITITSTAGEESEVIIERVYGKE